jgi:hypothetical protein
MKLWQKKFKDILQYGLYIDDRGCLYPDKYMEYLSKTSGIWQQPDELYYLLNYLKTQPIKINTFLNVGTFNGCTLNVIHKFLKKLNPDLQTITIDPIRHHIIEIIDDIYYSFTTTENYKNEYFDFVFIDGDHHYNSVLKDYTNVGVNSKICAIHDIKDSFIENNKSLEGGPIRLWNEIKQDKCFEIISTEKPYEVMGIGVIKNV